jgi:uncharacterized membrane protein HdeD (DUF308 family)
MSLLVFTGLVSLLFGVLFLMSPETLGRWSEVGNRTVMVLDEKLSSIRNWVGAALLIAGAFMVWAAFPYSVELWYLHVIGVIALFFGLLFIAFPHGLKNLSRIFDTVLLSTDELILGVRKTLGILLLIAGAYIIYASVYTSGK